MPVCAAPQSTRTSGATIAIALVLLVGLPLLGVLTAGEPLARFAEFPPLTRYVRHAPFSWPVFVSMALFVTAVVGPIVAQVLRSQPTVDTVPETRRGFPWWGWLGLVWLAIAWVLAWNRFEWLAPVQRHSFTPLWLGYIATVNAATFRRSGQCLLTHQPRYLLALFAVSAIFWWYFEYLNRFVQNWYYTGIGEFSTMEYLVFGTLSFSTVLPAVICTRDLLATFPHLSAGLARFASLSLPRPCTFASLFLVVSAIALANIGRWPDYLFPLLWIAPLTILASLQAIRGETQVFQPLSRGDWRGLWLAALAALLCGVFWEMWNFGSLTHWEYAVPFVQRYPLFQMPLLGYAGYLPFGIECIAIANCLRPGTRDD